MYAHVSSLTTGSKSHKQVDGDVSRLLQRYYDPVSVVLSFVYVVTYCDGVQRTLFVVCAGNELFYIALYLMKWVHVPLSESFGITADGAVGYIVSFTWPQLMALVFGPICALKNFVNAVQLWKASKVLVGVDLAERAKAREEQLLKKH